MRRAHTVEQVRAAEAAAMAEVPEGALMQRAATALAHAVVDLLGGAVGRRVLLVVGSGDNGGDALWAGARLARRGCAVEAVLLAGERTHAEGLAALRAAGGRVVTTDEAAEPDVVLDGIVGIGGRGGLRPAAAAAMGVFPDVPVVAVDVPSGVAVDSGELDGDHVRATLTVTFGTHKVAHLVDPAAEACGVVELVDIGLRDLPPPAVESLQEADVAALLPLPAADAHKYSRGVVGLRTGSARYPGAAVLTAAGAGCGLAGLVRYDGEASGEVLAAYPDVVPGAGRVQAWVVGSGQEQDDALPRCLADGVPVVVDAGALAGAREAAGDLVLTPHAGELATLLAVEREAVEAAPLAHVRRAASELGQTVLLKGRRTLVASPDGRVRSNPTGTAWLGVAGTGDVLAGLVGALLAAGVAPYDAASAGAWLHGAAGQVASRGGPVTASRVAEALPNVVQRLLADR